MIFSSDTEIMITGNYEAKMRTNPTKHLNILNSSECQSHLPRMWLASQDAESLIWRSGFKIGKAKGAGFLQVTKGVLLRQFP